VFAFVATEKKNDICKAWNVNDDILMDLALALCCYYEMLSVFTDQAVYV